MAFAVTGTAIARNGDEAVHHHRHGAQQAGEHHRHHHHARIVRIVSKSATTTTTGTTPTPAPVSKSGATVASFTGGVLTLKLPDGSTIGGKVTDATRIECHAAGANDGDDHDQGDDHGGENGDNDQGDEHHGGQVAHTSDHGGGPGPSSGNSGRGSGDDKDQGDDRGGENGDDDNDDGAQQNCGAAALVEGTSVLAAELHVTTAGAVWSEIAIG